jgi:hypothetical protein
MTGTIEVFLFSPVQILVALGQVKDVADEGKPARSRRQTSTLVPSPPKPYESKQQEGDDLEDRGWHDESLREACHHDGFRHRSSSVQLIICWQALYVEPSTGTSPTLAVLAIRRSQFRCQIRRLTYRHRDGSLHISPFFLLQRSSWRGKGILINGAICAEVWSDCKVIGELKVDRSECRSHRIITKGPPQIDERSMGV